VSVVSVAKTEAGDTPTTTVAAIMCTTARRMGTHAGRIGLRYDRLRPGRFDHASEFASLRTRNLPKGVEMKRADAENPDRGEKPQPADGENESEPERSERQQDDKNNHAPEDPRVARRKRRRAIIIGCLIGLVVLLAGGAYGAYWYRTARYLIETDDAYTQTDDVVLAAQVSGYVNGLSVTDNQQVRKGQVIALIDDRTYRAEVDQAQADFVATSVNVANAAAQIELQHAVIAQAESDIQAAEATVTFAQEELDRYSKLAKTLAGTMQNQQRASADLRQHKAELLKAKAALETEHKRETVLETARDQAEAAVSKAQAALEQAKVNLSYTAIRAPIDGVVGDRKVEVGQYVQPGTRILTIVPLQSVYVVANYKETQLDRLHMGQAVEVSVDAYPDVVVKGRVDSLAPGSGAQFALLPPENATGNFTKIVQRVPVKILIDQADPLKDRLRPGLSVISTVDTRDTRGKSLRERPAQGGLPPPSSMRQSDMQKSGP
jgi:membrane fusion protein (multidrug efflux system)